MAIIVNNESRVLILADGHRVVRLTPGANQLDNDQWARVRSHVLDRLGEKKDDKSITEIGVEAKKGTGKDGLQGHQRAERQGRLGARRQDPRCQRPEGVEEEGHT